MLHNYLFLSAIIFSIGLYGVLSKKNAITILMCVELMLNSINISAVAFSRYVFNPYYLTDGNLQSLLTGQILSMFVILFISVLNLAYNILLQGYFIYYFAKSKSTKYL